MTETYPVPSYAASVWLAGDNIHVQFPACLADDRAHTVRFPNSERGIVLLLDVLRRRETELHIGTKGTPTQYQIERTLAGDAKYKAWIEAAEASRNTTAAQRAESEAFLAELGL